MQQASTCVPPSSAEAQRASAETQLAGTCVSPVQQGRCPLDLGSGPAPEFHACPSRHVGASWWVLGGRLGGRQASLYRGGETRWSPGQLPPSTEVRGFQGVLAQGAGYSRLTVDAVPWRLRLCPGQLPPSTEVRGFQGVLAQGAGYSRLTVDAALVAFGLGPMRLVPVATCPMATFPA